MYKNWTFFPKQCGHTCGSYGKGSGLVLIRGGLIRARAFLTTFAAQKLLQLPFLTKSRTKWVSPRPETSRAILSSLSLWDRSHIVVRCEFCESLARPSHHCKRVQNFEIARAALSALWACQIALVVARCSFVVKEFLCRVFFYRELAQRSCRGDVSYRSCTQSSCRDLVQRHCIEICWDLAKRYLTEILPRDL